MSPALLLQIIITTVTTLAIAAVAWWARKHPNRSKEHPERVRMPKVVPIVGWLFVCVGVITGLAGFASPEGPLGAGIASVAIFAGGMAFVAMYRNFYVVTHAYEVAFRSVLGKERKIPYCEIDHYHLQTMKGQRFLTVKSIHGVKLSLNIDAYDMKPLLRAIDYHQATGRWPVRVEAGTPESGR